MIDNIGSVQQQLDQDLAKGYELSDAQIIGVPQLDTYKACLQCKARVEPQETPLGQCSKLDCLMLQRYDLCSDQISAKILFSYDSGASTMSLHAFGQIVRDLAVTSTSTSDPVAKPDLLKSPQMSSVMYNQKGVITAFSRE